MIEERDVDRYVKAQWISSPEQVMRKSEEQMSKRMLRERLFFRRGKRRPRKRWLDNVVMGVRAWKGNVEDTAAWK